MIKVPNIIFAASLLYVQLHTLHAQSLSPSSSPQTANPTIQPSPSVAPQIKAPSKQPHTLEQVQYETFLLTKLTRATIDIRNIRERIDKLPEPKKTIARESLRTASGNLSVANLKYNELKAADPANWSFLRTKVDTAFSDLKKSISVASSKSK